MLPSTSRSSTSAEPWPRAHPLGPWRGCALTVDLEEWYHTCWIEEWVDPVRRPHLIEELDALVPRTLELLGELGIRATFFVLGEVAERWPRRIAEIHAAGHEIASHCTLHLRADSFSVKEFAGEVSRSRQVLESIIGASVWGFRAPEWSLRHAHNPRLRALAELGFDYDSSLSPALWSGSWRNPREPVLFSWRDGTTIRELPPATWGGAMRLPACGWTGRLAPARSIRRAIEHGVAAGSFPILTVHPWELVDRPVPGEMMGLPRLLHDAGRRGYAATLAERFGGLPWRRLGDAVMESTLTGKTTELDPVVTEERMR